MPASPLHDHSSLVLITEDCVERVMAQGVTKPENASKILRFHKGQVVPRSAVARVEARDVEVSFTEDLPKGIGVRPGALLDIDDDGNVAVPSVGSTEAVSDGGSLNTGKNVVGPGITNDSLGDPDAGSLEFDAESFDTVADLREFAAANEINLHGAQKREDIEKAIADDPRVAAKA
jgi:hypothetical protein